METRFGESSVMSRAGLNADADMLLSDGSILDFHSGAFDVDCVLVDEAQFLSASVVEQLRLLTKVKRVPVICYGLRTDFRTRAFPGSLRLLELADSIEEVKANLRGYTDEVFADELALNEVIGLIEKSERPVLYCGGGIITAGASGELLRFAESGEIPVTTTLMGVGGFPEEHPLSLRWLVMHGAAFANWAVNGEYVKRTAPTEPLVKLKDGCELLLAFGVLFDDRVTGRLDAFSPGSRKIHVDVDASSINKTVRADIPVLPKCTIGDVYFILIVSLLVLSAHSVLLYYFSISKGFVNK
jgi:hypothetical protein